MIKTGFHGTISQPVFLYLTRVELLTCHSTERWISSETKQPADDSNLFVLPVQKRVHLHWPAIKWEAGFFFYSLQHSKSRHFHSSTAKLVPGGANYFLSVSVVIGHFGRKTATINSKYQPNHVARLITYSKCPTICVLLFFCRGDIFLVVGFQSAR